VQAEGVDEIGNVPADHGAGDEDAGGGGVDAGRAQSLGAVAPGTDDLGVTERFLQQNGQLDVGEPATAMGDEAVVRNSPAWVGA
jgi:hypothetical protein